MVVKNEARRIRDCLAPIVATFDEVAIVDTGSSDGTPDLLRELGIVAHAASLDRDRCDCLCDARAQALRKLSTPWVLLLDADERVDPGSLSRLRAMPDDGRSAGYFGRWVNHVDGLAPFDDYKLFVFRNGLRTVGLVHDVPQHDIRARGLHAEWLPGFTVEHFPDPARRRAKAARYRERLRCAIAREPGFVRYQWFLGYMEFVDGRYADARRWLEAAAHACSRDFPVECLNSAMALADVHARLGDGASVRDTLDRAIDFFGSVAGDFEVAVNTRLGPWLAAARASAADRRFDEIRAYRFAC